MAGQRVDRDAIGRTLGNLRVLLEYAEAAERVNDDQREYCRTMIRTLSDIEGEAARVGQMLTAQAVKDKAITVTEAANAARISRNGIYKRVSAYFDTDGLDDNDEAAAAAP